MGCRDIGSSQDEIASWSRPVTAPLSSLADPADERFTEAQLAKVADFEAAEEPREVTVIRAMLELADNLDYYASKTTGGTHASGLEDAAAQLRAALRDPS